MKKPSFVKQAIGHKEASQLQTECAILQKAAHPNVIRVLSAEFSQDKGKIELAPVEGETLLNLSPPLAEIIQISTQIAITVAHIHSLGISHGSLSADKILVCSSSRVVIFDFAGAQWSLENSRADVEAIGTILQGLIETSANSLQISLQNKDSYRNLRYSLLDIAGRALTSKTNSAIEIAQSLNSLITRKAKEPSNRFNKQTPLVLVIAGVSLCAAFAVSWVLPAKNHDSVSIKPIHTSDTITIGNEHYAGGETGDVMLAGDWTCSNYSTVALLRPSTGEIFIFDQLPVNGGEAKGRRIGLAIGATTLDKNQEGNCEALVAKNSSRIVEIKEN